MSSATKGLEGIVAAQTYLSDVRGDVGELIYRGYDINELAGNVGYEETVHLLHYGKLPNRAELDQLKAKLASFRTLPQGVIDLIQSLPKDTVPMSALRTGISALGCFDQTADDNSKESLEEKALRIIAQIPIVTAYFHLYRQGKPLVESRSDLGEAANFLYLINGGKEADPESVDTLDMCYVLHADHGMNASTFASRVTIATLSDIYSAITSAIGTLKGPLHGGANEAVIRMLQEIGSLDNVDGYIQDCLETKKKVMGIGHRVYKVLDPRALKLRKMVLKMGEKVADPKWIKMSDKIAEIMLHEKGLHANVDFYSASVYYSLDIPIDLFTPIFAIARTSGWSAHVLEQMANNRLIRPQSDYIGPEGLTVTPIDER
jgi:citrate synthase